MSQESTLILLGILIAIAPFAGLPPLLRTSLIVIVAVGVVLIGVSLKARMRGKKPQEAEAVAHDKDILGGE